MRRTASAAVVAASVVAVTAAAVASSGGGDTAQAAAPQDAAKPSPAADAAQVRRLEQRARRQARRLGLTPPRPRPLPATADGLAERQRALANVVTYLTARDERPPAAAPARPRRLDRHALRTPGGRAYATAVRASARLGIDAPAQPPAGDHQSATRWRDVASWLAHRSERTRPAERNAAAARVALRNVGVPYAWGGSSPAGFDCSGLVAYAFGTVGEPLPHNTYAIWSALPKVPRGRLRAGDMVFFSGLGHMGIYVGRGRYVHAPHSGEVVEVARLDERSDYVGAVRA